MPIIDGDSHFMEPFDLFERYCEPAFRERVCRVGKDAATGERTLLVEGRPCPIQAFGLGNVRGVIFHLEVTSSEAARWADAYPSELEAVGKTRAQVIRECAEREPEMRELAYRLADNFLRLSR